jgi:hypothetical protein
MLKGGEPAGLTPSPRRGVHRVGTLNASPYGLDFDARTATAVRSPKLNDPDPLKNVRRDEEEFPLLAVSPLAIGRDLLMVLDLRGDGMPDSAA